MTDDEFLKARERFMFLLQQLPQAALREMAMYFDTEAALHWHEPGEDADVFTEETARRIWFRITEYRADVTKLAEFRRSMRNITGI